MLKLLKIGLSLDLKYSRLKLGYNLVQNDVINPNTIQFYNLVQYNYTTSQMVQSTQNIAVDTVELKSGAMYDNKPLSRGMYTVIYEAFDTSGNVANCTFTLVVQGKYSSR